MQADQAPGANPLPVCIPVAWRDQAGDCLLAYPRLHDPRLYLVVNCTDSTRGIGGERDYLAAVDDFGNLVRVRPASTAGICRFLNEHEASERRARRGAGGR